jgi:ATP-dependent helicase/nuclease subunit B
VRLGAFAPDAPFLPALARLWLADPAPSAEGLIILPSRRAAQSLAAAFLEANDGRALLLPRIIALGNIDEAGLLLSTGMALPPAIAPARRQAMLAKLILAQKDQSLPAALSLAAELAALLDEADYAEADLAEALPRLVPAELAEHWQKVLEFLSIVTRLWPDILRAEGRMNPAARLAALIRAQALQWAQTPPPGRLWMVAAEGVPAVARMARTVAESPRGFLVLPGYDPHLPDEAVEESHAQAGILALLAAIGARRDEILALPAPASRVPEGRAVLLSRALLPAAALGAWQEAFAPDLAGLSRLETGDEAQIATAIAMVLRGVLEIPGRSAALVTPDRGLAVRVAAALKRFGITADDSAGEPLAQTPPAVFLRLLARAWASLYAPLPLLSLLKHPLTACGLPPADCRAMARRLERFALRGPRPAPGFQELRFRLETADKQAERDFLTRLELMLEPLALPVHTAPPAALRALIEAGEALAGAPLWDGEAGVALSERLIEALSVLDELPDMEARQLPELLDVLLDGVTVRKPRAKDGHPRLAIWGLQEAALQSVDVAVLGGLVEGVWPAPAEPGPWLSRPMRRSAGLGAPEQKIGQAAHGFFALACACPEVVLAAPRRRERAPAVPARWLTRLDAMLAATPLPRHPAADWAVALDRPVTRETRPRPMPRPPAAARPARLSVSDIATLITDPYALYARKVLNIRELDPLDEESDESLFGDIVHAGLAGWFNAGASGGGPALTASLLAAMMERRPRAALETWWAARLERIAAWVVEAERTRPVAQIRRHEVPGTMALPGGVTLTGRADRLEMRADGVAIYDYKTGSVPQMKAVREGAAPQLPLEAAMAEAGAFGPEFAAEVVELAYIKLSGRAEAGDEKPLKPEQLRETVDKAAAALPALVAKFADPGMPYLAAPHPNRENKYDVYAGVSRRAEWQGEEQDNDGD